MNRIPVFATVAHAYGFAFHRYFRILGIVWAPLVVAMAVALMLTPGFVGNHIPIDDAEAIRRSTAHFAPLVFVFSLFIHAMIGVGVTELALGKRSDATLVYFSLGPSVWRMIGAYLLLILVMILIYIGLVIITIILGIGGAAAVKSLALSPVAHLAAVGLLVLFCIVLFTGVLMYIMARLTFLIPPVVVDERKIDLARGWELTKGNFWRIFWIGVAIFVPLILVEAALALSLYGIGVFEQLFTIVHAGLLRQLSEAALQSRMAQWSLAMRTQGLHVWPYAAIAGIVIQTFWFGLLFGAAAFGYRALNPEAAPSARDPG